MSAKVYLGLAHQNVSLQDGNDPGSIPGPWTFFALLVIIQPSMEFCEVGMIEEKYFLIFPLKAYMRYFDQL